MKNLVLVLIAAAVVTLTSCDLLEWTEPGLLVPRTVDEDPTLQSISVNGTQLHSETYGDPNDPMIVVIHGGPGSDYRSMLKCSQFAADSFFVVFYDQRGSGLSRRHNKDLYTIQLFIDDLDAVIKYYRKPGQKVILLGHSWGAMLATAYINQYPAEIRGAILSEPGGLIWDDTNVYIKRYMNLRLFDETSNDFVYLDQFLTASDHIKLDYRAAVQSAGDFAKGNKIGNSGPLPFWRHGAVCNAAAFEYAQNHPFDFTTNLSMYTTKVLFMYSSMNEAYGKAHAEKVSSAYPNVQLEMVAGTGHEIPWEGWENYQALVRPYLTSIR